MEMRPPRTLAISTSWKLLVAAVTSLSTAYGAVINVSGSNGSNVLTISSSGGIDTSSAVISTWSTSTFEGSPADITAAYRLSSYSNSHSFVTGALGSGSSGVYGALSVPFDIVSAAGSSTVIGIVFDDDGNADDDFFLLFEQGDPMPDPTYTIPAFNTTVTFSQGTFGDLIPGTYLLGDNFSGSTLVIVPEPGSSALLAFFGAVCFLRRRR